MVNLNNSNTKKIMQILSGPILLFLAGLLLKDQFGIQGAYAIGTALWMISWWVFRPIHICITAFVPVVTNALLQMTDMSPIISQYSSATVVLLFGSSLICMPWDNTGLGNRLALGALQLVGTSVRRQIFIWFALSCALTIALPNSAVCTMLTPVAVTMLAYIGHKDLSKSALAPPILLAIAYGSNVGGAATPLGGAMNLTAVTYLEEFTGQELMYIDWSMHMLPFVIIMFAVVMIVMQLFPLPIKEIEGTKGYFSEQYKALGKMKRGELICIVFFLLALGLAFLRPLYEDILPGLSPTYVFLVLGIAMFFFKDENKKPLITWPVVEKNMMWNMLFLFAGGLALGQLIVKTGAVNVIADLITGMNLTGGLTTIVAFVLLTAFLSEVTSQTAAAAIMVPIVLNVTTSLELNPVPFIFITIMAFNTSYILPIGVRAIPIGYGMSVTPLIRRGLIMALVNSVAIIIFGYVLMTVWPFFSHLSGM